MPDVAEHRFHCGKALTVFRLSFRAVDSGLHPVGEAWLSVSLALEETHLPGLGLGRGAQALVALFTRYAVLLRTLEFDGSETIDDTVAAIAVEHLARRADAGVRVGVVVEIRRTIHSGLLLGLARFVVQWIGVLFVLALVFETFVAGPHAVVGDQGIDCQFGELFEVGFTVVTRVCGDQAGRGDERLFVVQGALDRLDYRHQQLLLATGAVRLGVNDDLVFGVHCRHASVALDDALAGRHLGRFVVGAVTLADSAFAAFAVFRVGGEPLSQLGGIVLQAGDALVLFLPEIGFDGFLVFLPMAFEHDASGGFKLAGLVFEVGAGAALLFGCVAGELDAVDGEHLAPDQALPVAQVEHLGEDAGDVVGKRRDKSGDGGEVGLGVATQGDKGDVVAADGFDAAAGDDALAVGEQHDLEQHGGRISSSACFIVPELGIEAGHIQFVINEVVECVFEAAGKQLPLQVYGKETRTGVDVFVACHALRLCLLTSPQFEA